MTDPEKPPSLDMVRQRLKELPNTANTRQSRQGKIRALLPEIEIAIAQGVPRTTIVEELNELGIAISLPIFATALHRARAAQEKKTSGRQAPALAPNTAQAPTDIDQSQGAERLTKKQQRELAADQWITPAHNPIIDRLIKESKS
jgi:hypothetical protein